MTVFLIITGVFLLIFSLGEWLHRAWQWPANETRRLSHIFSGLLAALLPTWLMRDQILLMAGLFLVGLLLSKWLRLFRSIHSVPRRTVGEFAFPLAVGLAALLFLPANETLYLMSLLILAFADAAASLVGSFVRSHHLVFTKTVAGSAAFFFVTLAIAAAFLTLPMAILVALILTVVELLSPYGTDNITLVAAVGLMHWLQLLL